MGTTNFSPRIDLRDLVVLEGANLLSRKPVICLDLRYEDVDPIVLRQIAEILVSLLANAAERDAGIGEGALGASLDGPESASVAGLVACLALELQRLKGHNLRFAFRQRRTNPDRNIAAFEYRDALLGRLAGQTAISLASTLIDKRVRRKIPDTATNYRHSPLDDVLKNAVIPGGARHTEEERYLHDFLRSAASIDIGHMANLVVREAEQSDLPWSRLFPNRNIIQVGQGAKLQRFYEGYTNHTSWLANAIGADKAMASEFFRAQGISAAENVLVDSPGEAIAAARRIGFPVVVKPNSAGFGVGISVGVNDDEAVGQGYQLARTHGPVIVERHIAGDHHRLTVIHGRVLAVARQKPAHVVGDGRNTIARLVEGENELRTDLLSDHLKKIPIDDEAVQILKGQNQTLGSIPAKGTLVFLRQVSNLSQGGTLENVTEAVHPDNVAMAERAARIVGIDVAGVDFITTDITRPHFETGGAICEINTDPEWVAEDGPHLTAALLKEYFPSGEDGRIPVTVVLGAGGATRTSHSAASIISFAGRMVGVATQEAVLIDRATVVVGDYSNVEGAKMVLGDPAVEIAILETTFRNISEQGLGIDRCNIVALLDSDDSEYYAEDEAVLNTKKLAAVIASDLLVISASDPHFWELKKHATAVCVIAVDRRHPNALKHAEEGGTAILVDDAQEELRIEVRTAGKATTICIPSDLGGAHPNSPGDSIRDVCFAVGIAVGYGVSSDIISQALSRPPAEPDRASDGPSRRE